MTGELTLIAVMYVCGGALMWIVMEDEGTEGARLFAAVAAWPLLMLLALIAGAFNWARKKLGFGK